MSPDIYSFACPACGIHLSVPRVLAGVRGPCPQCHREITAPEPTEGEFPTPFADPAPAEAPAAAPARAVAADTAPRSVPEPAVEAVPDFGDGGRDEPADWQEEEDRGGRPSRWMIACGAVLLLALLAGAELVFLPPATLRAWISPFSQPGTGNLPGDVASTPGPAGPAAGTARAEASNKGRETPAESTASPVSDRTRR